MLHYGSRGYWLLEGFELREHLGWGRLINAEDCMDVLNSCRVVCHMAPRSPAEVAHLSGVTGC